MKINTFHKKYKKITPANGFMTEKSEHRQRYDRVMAPYIVCADGFTMSVQASGSHYCEPRGNYNRYREFEIGFPSQKESLIMRYCEDESKPTDTVYSFVPCSVVNDVLEKHGGIDIDATLKRAEEMQMDMIDEIDGVNKRMEDHNKQYKTTDLKEEMQKSA